MEVASGAWALEKTNHAQNDVWRSRSPVILHQLAKRRQNLIASVSNFHRVRQPYVTELCEKAEGIPAACHPLGSTQLWLDATLVTFGHSLSLSLSLLKAACCLEQGILWAPQNTTPLV